MKVRLKANLAGPDGVSGYAGDELDLAYARAERLVIDGVAEFHPTTEQERQHVRDFVEATWPQGGSR